MHAPPFSSPFSPLFTLSTLSTFSLSLSSIHESLSEIFPPLLSSRLSGVRISVAIRLPLSFFFDARPAVPFSLPPRHSAPTPAFPTREPVSHLIWTSPPPNPICYRPSLISIPLSNVNSAACNSGTTIDLSRRRSRGSAARPSAPSIQLPVEGKELIPPLHALSRLDAGLWIATNVRWSRVSCLLRDIHSPFTKLSGELDSRWRDLGLLLGSDLKRACKRLSVEQLQGDSRQTLWVVIEWAVWGTLRGWRS